MILLEPAWVTRDELQAYGRVRRIGQKKMTYTYKCINTDSIPEATILKRQAGRKELADLSFKTTTDGMDFAKSAPPNFVNVDEGSGHIGAGSSGTAKRSAQPSYPNADLNDADLRREARHAAPKSMADPPIVVSDDDDEA